MAPAHYFTGGGVWEPPDRRRNGRRPEGRCSRPPTEAVLLRFRGEPAHKSVAIPKLNVVAINELFGRFDGGGIGSMIMQKFGYNGIERPVQAAAVGAITWRGAGPLYWGGGQYSQSPIRAEGGA